MASTPEIIEEIEGLAVHCRPALMSVEDRARWLKGWCEDLAPFPIESVRLACNRYRMGDDRRFPMPGQMMQLVKSVTVQGDAGEGAQIWGQVSDEEYHGMSLRDKIRHQTILQLEAATKAGPQWEHGRHKPASEMPPTWHEWRERSANHGKEVKRLREILKNANHKHAAE